MTTPVVIAARRTPIGESGGALRHTDVYGLAAAVLRAVLADAGTDRVDEVVLGNVFGPGGNPARVAALQAGLGTTTPGMTIDRQCASGLAAITTAAAMIRGGVGECYLAGGAESMSRAPWVVPKPEAGLPRGPQTMHDTSLGWRLVNPRMAERYSTESMGETAENVAERYGIARSEQDSFALRSHARAVEAARDGRFDEELSPVEAPPPGGRGEPLAVPEQRGEELVGRDPRPRLVRQRLVGLRLAHERLELLVARGQG